jgi:hypothetical protein
VQQHVHRAPFQTWGIFPRARGKGSAELASDHKEEKIKLHIPAVRVRGVRRRVPSATEKPVRGRRPIGSRMADRSIAGGASEKKEKGGKRSKNTTFLSEPTPFAHRDLILAICLVSP